MPMQAPKPCAHPGCSVLVRDGSSRCPSHKSPKKPTGFSRQLTKTERGYGYAWQKLREVVLQRDSGLCQMCRAKGLLRVGNICDHKTPKAEGGTDDLDNLQIVCKPCHTLKTAAESARGGGGGYVKFEPEWLPPALIPVCVVCGPPGSGKTTFVKEHAAPTDLILDADVIASELFGRPLFAADIEQISAATRYRNKLLAGLADAGCGYTKAWVIATAGSDAKRQFWRRKYGDVVIMTTPKTECMERVRNDERRSDKAKRGAIDGILRWV